MDDNEELQLENSEPIRTSSGRSASFFFSCSRFSTRFPWHPWVSTPAYYLFPVSALSKVFCGKFCAGLQQLYAACKVIKGVKKNASQSWPQDRHGLC